MVGRSWRWRDLVSCTESSQVVTTSIFFFLPQWRAEKCHVNQLPVCVMHWGLWETNPLVNITRNFMNSSSSYSIKDVRWLLLMLTFPCFLPFSLITDIQCHTGPLLWVWLVSLKIKYNLIQPNWPVDSVTHFMLLRPARCLVGAAAARKWQTDTLDLRPEKQGGFQF